MSATRVRIDANRANARLSTGPRTTEGKARSALNALRHGITAKSPVAPGESLDPYQKFTRKYIADLAPVGEVEKALARNMAEQQWRIGHCKAHYQELLVAAIADPIKLMTELNKLALYEQRLVRTFQVYMKEFRAAQTLREQREIVDLEDAAARLKHCQTKQLPYDPAEDGFVFSTQEVESFTARRDRIEEAERAAESPQPMAAAA